MHDERSDSARNPTSGAAAVRHRWAFRLFSAVIVPLLVLVLLETGLRLAGTGYRTSFTLECEVESVPSRCDNPEFTKQFFPSRIARTAPPFVFPAKKPPNTVRIFVLGGSAAQGDPEPTYGVSRILAVLLRDRYPGVRFEVVNTAITAINSHVVRTIADDLARRQGDVFVVYMGNNEVVGPYGSTTLFSPLPAGLLLVRTSMLAKTTRIGQLATGALRSWGEGEEPEEWRGMEMFLGHPVRPDHARLPRLYEHFEENLESIVDRAFASGTGVVLGTVGVNLQDCAPFASMHRPDLGEADRLSWERLFEEGREHASEGRPEDALRALLEAERIDGSFAELQFRIARILRDRGDHDQALERYRRAADLDVLRFRADPRINEIIRSVASEPRGGRVRLFDAERALTAASPRGLPGSSLFYEHVHLTFRGNYLLALGLLDEIEPLLPSIARDRRVDRPPMSEADCADRLAFTDFDRQRMASEVRRRLTRAPFTHQASHGEATERLEREIEALRSSAGPEGFERNLERYLAAIRLAPEDPWLRFNFAALLEHSGNLSRAVEEYRFGLRRLPMNVPSRERLGSALAELGRFEEALTECRRLIDRTPEFAPPYRTMAYALAGLGRFDDAVETYRTLLDLDPGSVVEIQNEIGRIRLNQKRYEEAIEAFATAVRHDELSEDGERNPDAHFNHGFALDAVGRADEARAAFARAAEGYRRELEREPTSAPLNLAAGRALARTGDLPGAERHFREAVRLEPGNPAAHANLVRMLGTRGRREEAAEACAQGIDALNAAGRPSDAERLRGLLEAP